MDNGVKAFLVGIGGGMFLSIVIILVRINHQLNDIYQALIEILKISGG